ncbi:MAG: DUF2304 domain-containing protein [Actinobacteria bacterium]|nr:DUF2304 domain-containing protein [Actinomycetota bacterium]NIS30916.1 DUF2304 domain-containing protein [Actinomycetota bacterium]NIU22370.1 DUF2304 domain-containing protein [Actinomycetota bacterium]NIU66096.1 DUF2304 domain-containing protein [Actinomycetota bacterium]NIV90518.1 DUF2304 family protein [Actinomycetota bacterium]
MSSQAHLVVATVIILTVLFIYRLVRQRVLKSKYALLWSGVAVALLPLAAVPDILVPISDAVGIEYEPATILFASTAFLFATTVHLSYEMSRVEARTQDLAEELALLRAHLDVTGAGAGPD